MAVNGGAGNAISVSEIQSFYGGPTPLLCPSIIGTAAMFRKQALIAAHLAQQSIILQQS